jgi:site-specific recombinase XerD
MSRTSELEPIDPRTAQQLFLDHNETECTESTVRTHRYHTNEFVAWCEENDVDNLNDLTGRDLQALRLWRKEEDDINLVTLNNYMCSLRVFIKWCGSIEVVPENLYDKVMMPRVSPDDQQAEETLDAETATEILAYLSTVHHASVEHAMLGLLWGPGTRIGAANGLDVDDVDLAEEQLQLVHRPGEGTTLKNGSGGERPIAIAADFADVLDAYIERLRKDVPDDRGRGPQPRMAECPGRRAGSCTKRPHRVSGTNPARTVREINEAGWDQSGYSRYISTSRSSITVKCPSLTTSDTPIERAVPAM